MEYNRILTYFMVLRSIKDFEAKVKGHYAMVGEMSSSRHDVFQIKHFLDTLNCAYSKYTDEKLYFRLVVIDYSWASIHAVLNSLNNEDPINYANRIFRMLQGLSTAEDDEKSLLVSCVAHTMHRFTKSFKKSIKPDNQSFVFYSYCFSLMLNSKTKDEIENFFYSIVVVSLCQYSNDFFLQEYEKLRKAFKSRNESKDILNILEQSITDKNHANIDQLLNLNGDIVVVEDEYVDSVDYDENVDSDECGSGSDDGDENECNDSEIDNEYDDERMPIRNNTKIDLHKSFLESLNLKDSTRKNSKDSSDKQKKETIKTKSPFNRIFVEITNKVKSDPRLKIYSKESNVLYSPLFLEFLLDKFMPYCFIWASFSMNNLSFTRMTNGIIEKYNQFTKRNVPKKIRPHRYLNAVSQTIKGINL